MTTTHAAANPAPPQVLTIDEAELQLGAARAGYAAAVV